MLTVLASAEGLHASLYKPCTAVHGAENRQAVTLAHQA